MLGGQKGEILVGEVANVDAYSGLHISSALAELTQLGLK